MSADAGVELVWTTPGGECFHRKVHGAMSVMVTDWTREYAETACRLRPCRACYPEADV